MTIEQQIKLIRRTFGRYPDYSGGCLKFSLILHLMFGVRVTDILYNSDHILTVIDGAAYDIDGYWNKPLEGFHSIRDFGLKTILSQFRHLLSMDDITFLQQRYA